MIECNLTLYSFHIGHTTVSYLDTSRGNRKIRAEVFYPSGTTGKNTTETATGKFPVLCFGHGYQVSWDSYKYLCNSIVPHGFIIAFPKTERGVFPSHTDFAKDIAFLMEELLQSGYDPSSVFYNHIDTMNCVMGHSMGGGSAILAARINPSINSLAILAPLNIKPVTNDAASELEIPSLIFSGDKDWVTRPEIHHLPIYVNLKSPTKTIITIKGGGHCQMADKSLPCRFAEFTRILNSEITGKDQQAIIIKYLLPWLNYHLKGDSKSAKEFDEMIEKDFLVEFEGKIRKENTD